MTFINRQSAVKHWVFRGHIGESTNARSFCVNHIKINLIVCKTFFFKYMCNCSCFVEHCLCHLIKQVDPRLNNVIGQSWCVSYTVLHPSYTVTRIDLESVVILYIMPHSD